MNAKLKYLQCHPDKDSRLPGYILVYGMARENDLLILMSVLFARKVWF